MAFLSMKVIPVGLTPNFKTSLAGENNLMGIIDLSRVSEIRKNKKGDSQDLLPTIP